jgi:hypothetical protein
MVSYKRYIDTTEDSISNYLKEVRKIDLVTKLLRGIKEH